MKENVGTVDRSLRVMLGLALFFAGWFGSGGALGVVLMIVGVVLIATGLVSSCPIYSILGIDTVEKPDPRGH